MQGRAGKLRQQKLDAGAAAVARPGCRAVCKACCTPQKPRRPMRLRFGSYGGGGDPVDMDFFGLVSVQISVASSQQVPPQAVLSSPLATSHA